MEGYQVSAQCMALVRDNCLVPTKDAPELGYVRESTDKQYVPDVFYKVSKKETQRPVHVFLSLFFLYFLILIRLHVRGIYFWSKVSFFSLWSVEREKSFLSLDSSFPLEGEQKVLHLVEKLACNQTLNLQGIFYLLCGIHWEITELDVSAARFRADR